ncbi:hypothetical protein BGE01nite_52120 [Brevifollis gellanilyticus]|uniref:Lipoprotein n=2 Tax=Brevifollis gellanilyticus TaxID=748831 RepID=A0A512MHW4_9BACT|nr:hypothetical protein BGE01nite_52120 [Brevifollis gellanilyticus]
MKCVLAAGVMMILGVVACAAADMPVSAEIVEVPAERRDWGEVIGNVRVKFKDGHTEMWTKNGKCLHVLRSDSGLVGWSRYTRRNDHGEPVNNMLRVMISPEQWKDVKTDLFIEDWGFADGDTTVILKTRGRHGPSYIQRFLLKTGELLNETKGSGPHAATPDWAKPYADDQPETK